MQILGNFQKRSPLSNSVASMMSTIVNPQVGQDRITSPFERITSGWVGVSKKNKQKSILRTGDDIVWLKNVWIWKSKFFSEKLTDQDPFPRPLQPVSHRNFALHRHRSGPIGNPWLPQKKIFKELIVTKNSSKIGHVQRNGRATPTLRNNHAASLPLTHSTVSLFRPGLISPLFLRFFRQLPSINLFNFPQLSSDNYSINSTFYLVPLNHQCCPF